MDMKMLNSGNQYLRPEYLSPLPTTLDAKKSPLALLAQTCNNIGADNPNNKPIVPALEKSKDGNSSDSGKEKTVIVSDDSSSNNNNNNNNSSSSNKTSFKPYESLVVKKEENSSVDAMAGSGGKRTPSSKRSSPLIGMSSRSPVGSTGSCGGKLSPAASDSGRSSAAAKSDSGRASCSTVSTSCTSTTSCTSQNTLSGLGYSSNPSLGLDLGRNNDAKDSLASMSLGLSAYKAALNGLNPLANCTGCGPVSGLPMDAVVSNAHTYPSSIATQSAALKGTYQMGATAMSPYVGYARVKTSSGGTALVPVCRDPYCVNCQFNMQSAQLSGCPSGCTQCNHERLAPTAFSFGHHGLVSGLSSNVAAMSLPGGHSFPAHPLLPRPNVCSWMVGDTYCGKRFSTSEELLQHLRTHTSLSTSDSPLTSLIPPSMSLSSAGLGAACHLHYSTAASMATHGGALRRTYPTSLSPVSSLSQASRYHPYKPTLGPLPGNPYAPPLGHPALGMYYSPYSLYGQRLGPSVNP